MDVQGTITASGAAVVEVLEVVVAAVVVVVSVSSC